METSPCTQNIGPRERRKRLVAGLFALTCAGLLSVLVVNQRSFPLAWLVFLPALGGWIGIFEAADRTCVFLAARGERDLDAGREPLRSEGDAGQMRQRARRLCAKSLAAALATTVPVLILASSP